MNLRISAHTLSLGIALLLLACLSPVPAQSTVMPGEDAPAQLRIATVPEGALVFLNGTPVGETPLMLDSLSPGSVILRILSPDVHAWPGDVVTDTIHLEAGEERDLRYDVRRLVVVRSDPFGAAVFVGDSLVGTTPAMIAVPPPEKQRVITIRKEGYEPVTAAFPQGLSPLVDLRLNSTTGANPADMGVFHDPAVRSGDNLRLYIAGAATIVSGIAAASFKIRADNRYDRYLSTGDRALLDQTNRLDTAAGIALAATQISLGLFTYFLLSD